jgi:hypothetical protein
MKSHSYLRLTVYGNPDPPAAKERRRREVSLSSQKCLYSAPQKMLLSTDEKCPTFAEEPFTAVIGFLPQGRQQQQKV